MGNASASVAAVSAFMRHKLFAATDGHIDHFTDRLVEMADDQELDQMALMSYSLLVFVCKMSDNKHVEKYNSVISEKSVAKPTAAKRLSKNNKRKKRRKNTLHKRVTTEREKNEKYLKNLSDNTLTDHQVSVLAKGLKFIETPVTNENKIRQQLLRDFEQFARRMRLRYIFHGNDKEPHPFHVKSNWIPPVQPSIALERYFENIKLSLAEIEITKPKHNLSYNEHKAVKELQNNTAINLKRADKGTTTVILNKRDKIQEAQVQLDNRDHYRPLENPMVTDTLKKVNELIAQLHNGKHLDDMTKKWLSQTPNPPRIPIFYTLTKIHKPLPPIAQKQKSYLKDTTDFINFIEKTQVSNDTILVSMDVTSLYTNIPQEEGITIVCQAYEKYHNNNPPIPSHYLKQMLGLILKENSLQFNGVNYLQCFGTAMGTRMAVAFANLFMAEIETKLLHQSSIKPRVWKRYIDDVFSLWDVRKQDIDLFIEQANTFHPTIKFTAEISETEITFLDTVVYKGHLYFVMNMPPPGNEKSFHSKLATNGKRGANCHTGLCHNVEAPKPRM
nr:uncharacterized protein LOC131781097 [Pocillopora verrucosa]